MRSVIDVLPTLLLISGVLVAAARTEAAMKPNIVVIVADDLGYADVGFNGGTKFKTPNLDRLAATGVNLTNFRTCPMCSPTRAGVMTGRWPLRFGMMRAVVPPWSTYGLPAEEQTLPELLATGGYEERACIGKWHLGHTRRSQTPLGNGFTHFYGHYNGAIGYFNHLREDETDWHNDWETVHEEGYSTDLLGDEAARFIREASQDSPYFVYLPFNAPHSPYEAKAEDLAKYPDIKMPNRKAYAAMVDSLDQAIGRVLQAIEARGDAENTLVWFFSDNGGIPNVGSSNDPWRGGKLTVYEGGTRVCAAIHWPAGGLSGGRKFDERIGYIDVLPTLLTVAGVQEPKNLDGINVFPALQGQEKVPSRPWFSYMHQSDVAHASVHDGDWKLIARGDAFAKEPAEPVEHELYDLAADPREANNVASRRPEIVERLKKELREFGALRRPGVEAFSEGKKGFKAPKDWLLPD